MSFYEELTDKPLSVLIDYWFGEPIDKDTDPDLWFEEVAHEIARNGKAGAAFLVEQITAENQTRAHCLIGGLLFTELPKAIRKRLIRPFLTSHVPRERSEAISAFCYFRDRSVRALVEPRLADDDVVVRVRALTYMGKVFPLESLDLLLVSLDDPIWNVRATAIDEIDELEDEELAASFMGRLWPFMDDPHHYVRDAASWYFKTRLWDFEDASAIRAQLARETDVRRVASLIRYAGDQRYLDIVLDHMNDPRPTVRLAALDELRAPWGSVVAALERDLDFIKRCASDPDPRVREMVTQLDEHLEWERERATKVEARPGT